MKKFYFLFLFALIASIGNLYAAEVTYTFTSKTWEAKCDGVVANWTPKKEGAGFSNGVQATDAFKTEDIVAISPKSFEKVTKVTVAYHTNSKKGAGTISVKIGDNTGISKSVTKTGGTKSRSLEYTLAENQTGNVALAVKCTTNSIYVESVSITYEDGTSCGVPTFSVEEGTYKEAQAIKLTAGEGGEVVYYTINDGPEQQYIDEPIKLEEDGTYKITAYTAANGALAKSTTVTKTYVISLPLDVPYILCEDAAWLTDGAKIIFVGKKTDKYYGLSVVDDNIITGGLVTISEKNLTEKDAAVKVFVVGRTANGVTFNTDAGYLAADKTASKGNLSYAAGNEGDCFHWTVSVANEKATVENVDVTGLYTNLQFNTSAKNPRFGAYRSDFDGGNLSIYLLGSTSSVSSMSAEGVKVFAAEGGVEVVAAEATDVAVYTVAGQLVRQARVAEGSALVNVAPGFYVVRANGTATKVIVR